MISIMTYPELRDALAAWCERAEKVEKAGTPGPWKLHKARTMAHMHAHEGYFGISLKYDQGVNGLNAELVQTARNAFPELVAFVRESLAEECLGCTNTGDVWIRVCECGVFDPCEMDTDGTCVMCNVDPEYKCEQCPRCAPLRARLERLWERLEKEVET